MFTALIHLSVIELKECKDVESFGKNDLFVQLTMGSLAPRKTTTKSGAGSSATFNENFELYVWWDVYLISLYDTLHPTYVIYYCFMHLWMSLSHLFYYPHSTAHSPPMPMLPCMCTYSMKTQWQIRLLVKLILLWPLWLSLDSTRPGLSYTPTPKTVKKQEPSCWNSHLLYAIEWTNDTAQTDVRGGSSDCV